MLSTMDRYLKCYLSHHAKHHLTQKECWPNIIMLFIIKITKSKQLSTVARNRHENFFLNKFLSGPDHIISGPDHILSGPHHILWSGPDICGPDQIRLYLKNKIVFDVGCGPR